MPRQAGSEKPPAKNPPESALKTDDSRPSLTLDPSDGLVFVTGSTPRLSSVTDSLRRARLRAAALFLVVTLVALLVRNALTGGHELLTLQAGIVCGIATALVVLWSRVRLSERSVRVLEFTVFGLTAAYLSARQYELMHVWVKLGDETSVVSSVKSTIIGTILLTFAYGMLIPNTWQAAARVVLAIVALPVATELFLLLTNPEAFQIAWRFASWPRIIEDASNILIAAGLSVYGTHVINTLRTEAFEARQLNQYRLGERIGGGGMGDVYLAEHRLLKRPCALKLIRPDAASDPLILSRFEREVQATARLSHPNTVEIYDYGRTEEGTFYYVMEYLPGLSLDELVKRHGPMPPGRVIYLLRQVCGALAEAHAAGLIHRDVKPANIFVCFRGDRYDVVKLLDFGLVKAPEHEASPLNGTELNNQGMVRGTPLYMAPEQITGTRELDYRCDLYALGAVAYMTLTGRPPFTGSDSSLVLTAQVRDPVAPPRLARPDIPEDLEAVVLRCLAKAPEDRFADAENLADALARCASAPEWNAAKAALWWREFEPAVTAPLQP
jgi:eukaryotic-like serine/threonine-protein kinase